MPITFEDDKKQREKRIKEHHKGVLASMRARGSKMGAKHGAKAPQVSKLAEALPPKHQSE
jgi:hypothetical protein